MITEIEKRNLISFAMLLLAKDKMYLNLSVDKRLEVVFDVISLGYEIADWVLSEFGDSDPRKIALKLGANIVGIDSGNFKRSEYRFKEKEIIIYRDALDRLCSEIVIPELAPKMLGLLVSLELFHHLEKVKTGFIYKRYKFKRKFNFGFYIKSLSDIAAIAFAVKLLDIKFSPQVFNYLIYIMFMSDFKN
ncbi:hypothetical protein A2526_04195 [candidate division WOR-1 bacterium RIFOXYD2_FULL_36_8]|uniref:Uncharacterized protein n=1 Tax=candidate division WOR-1 bacterium RIFOXYB2_FULL_36_35 TaxID=1802578 RepID=A0A1F4S198_UNCSA|nr:MAG: hypothetical protein A2230_03480 [candidate division WOR-1 bacterium RIFOXYA2_FULL_36_21]OGC14159.1 MAG: hypothetical protein A2290_00590 [candidate division WOR-1 bacterium RIFOXYB2_FULL_36_35]OGC15381.1 MAG: hypothetical protein A2282_01580 [candidate division WOR-1 bacterium RIFOXYA12_FULL_36_13]OGC40078.1 MAG: hypothetical protein A2526_04195 [candidate division WOR-1 bacterium RIFOXYD2_FULL_36_8]